MSRVAAVLDATTVKARAVRGVQAGSARVAASLGLKVISSIILARLLIPADYGVFGAVAYLAGLAWLLCEMGLVASLVRQSRIVSDDDEWTVLVAQMAQTAVVVAAVVALAPMLVGLYELPPAAAWCLVAAACGHFLSSLRAIPYMRLQRDLRFGTLAGMELLDTGRWWAASCVGISRAWRTCGRCRRIGRAGASAGRSCGSWPLLRCPSRPRRSRWLSWADGCR